jgi:hypothetical protein
MPTLVQKMHSRLETLTLVAAEASVEALPRLADTQSPGPPKDGGFFAPEIGLLALA